MTGRGGMGTIGTNKDGNLDLSYRRFGRFFESYVVINSQKINLGSRIQSMKPSITVR